ncbi:MAG: hypothetical protein WA828_18775 [Coleofasciculaceae cyanobacterium]
MTNDEIEAVLKVAFMECEAALCPLTEQQKKLLLQVITESVRGESLTEANGNPLDELTVEQRQELLQFVKEQEKQDYAWKIKLLNDWLHDRNSGTVQFIRELYGPQWLNRVKPVHLAQYFDAETALEVLKIKVGSRIEVSNGLWEWVQENGPCSREWFPCTVVKIAQNTDSDNSYYSCVIRFDNGSEYEIQGIYQWNRYNWRWVS